MVQTVDVVIVGTGLAGTYLALNLPTHMNIIMLSAHKDNSSLAQGGLATCVNPEDSVESHAEDTLVAGHYINNADTVRDLVKDGPSHLDNLINLGVPFDLDDTGAISATLEGGHSHRRVVHIEGDQTGISLMNTLKTQINARPNITIIHDATLTKLLDDSGRTTGIIYAKDQQLHTIHSQFIALATGGIGDLYKHTTNQPGCYGSGIALALQAGAKVRDMRYIQFHPSAYYNEKQNQYFLLTEALRGEGAHLVDHNMYRFMPNIHELAELAPRDIVSNAIYDVMTLNRIDYVFLDTRHLDNHFLKTRFPGVYGFLKEQGLTLGVDLIPVTPVAHYTIGGIVVDHDGRTTIDHLYACGEVTSSGVHGANRLASNSLLECLVYGSRAALSIARDFDFRYKCQHNENLDLSNLTRLFLTKSSERHINYATRIKDIMTRYVGISRTDDGLTLALRKLNSLNRLLNQIKFDNMHNYHAYNMTVVAMNVTNDALAHDSLGCHHKEQSLKEQRIC